MGSDVPRSDSRAPGPCVSSAGPQLSVSLFLDVGRFLGPTSVWSFWVPEGTLTSPLVLDEPPGGETFSLPPLMLPAPTVPLPSSCPGQFLDTLGLGQKGGVGQPARFFSSQHPPAPQKLSFSQQHLGRPAVLASVLAGGGKHSQVMIPNVRDAVRLESCKNAGGGDTGTPGVPCSCRQGQLLSVTCCFLPGVLAEAKLTVVGKLGLFLPTSWAGFLSWPHTAPVRSRVSKSTAVSSDHTSGPLTTLSPCRLPGSAATGFWTPCL